MKCTSFAAALLTLVALAAGCGGNEQGAEGRPGGGPPGGNRAWPAGDAAATAVPVEVATVERRDISSYIETNGTLEAENEVDVLARAAGPITQLRAEEGQRVRRGDLLAQLEQDEIAAQLEISRVELGQAQLTFERASKLQNESLISDEEYTQASTAYEAAKAQFERNRIQFGYTEIRAPFDGLIVTRYVDLGQTVTVNERLFRLSDFTPLLCPIQVPERDLPKLRLRQRAYLLVEAWPDRKFDASVLRLSPVVDAATGTVRVTLDVDGQQLLRPGMFARVYLETDTHTDSLAIPRSALSLDSIGDTVYVADNGVAVRRDVELGYREGETVEVLSGLSSGEQVVVVGQDGLSEGTPIRVLGVDGQAVDSERVAEGAAPSGADRPRGGPGGMPAGGGRPDFSKMSPEQLEQAKERMRERGLTEEQINQRIEGGKPRNATP